MCSKNCKICWHQDKFKRMWENCLLELKHQCWKHFTPLLTTLLPKWLGSHSMECKAGKAIHWLWTCSVHVIQILNVFYVIWLYTRVFYDFLYRLHLAALHYNENGQRDQAATRDGDKRSSIVFPKYKKGGNTIREIKVDCTFGKYSLFVIALTLSINFVLSIKFKYGDVIVLSCCPFKISVGIRAFVIGLSQISSFFLIGLMSL